MLLIQFYLSIIINSKLTVFFYLSDQPYKIIESDDVRITNNLLK